MALIEDALGLELNRSFHPALDIADAAPEELHAPVGRMVEVVFPHVHFGRVEQTVADVALGNRRIVRHPELEVDASRAAVDRVRDRSGEKARIRLIVVAIKRRDSIAFREMKDRARLCCEPNAPGELGGPGGKPGRERRRNRSHGAGTPSRTSSSSTSIVVFELGRAGPPVWNFQAPSRPA
jgi:hypothetical protein